MDEQLTQKSCVPCQGGISPLAISEAEELLVQTPGWQLKEKGHHLHHPRRLVRLAALARPRRVRVRARRRRRRRAAGVAARGGGSCRDRAAARAGGRRGARARRAGRGCAQ